MATETQDAQSWQSIARTGSERSGNWNTSSTALNAEDGNYISHEPWVTFPDPPWVDDGQPYEYVPQGYRPANSPILRVRFDSFSLPVDHIIASADVVVRHKQGNIYVTGGRSIVFENTNTTLSNSYQSTSFAYPLVGLTIDTLNSGNATIDLLYHGAGPNIVPAILVDETPASWAFVEHVTLTVVTIPEPTHTREFESFRMVRIPEIGVR